MYRTLAGIVACLVAALVLVGFTFSASVEERADFRFMNATEPKTLDPQLATGEPEGRVVLELFEGLTRLDAKTLSAIPGVAERWDISEDERRYTFHLRPDAKWSDGRAVTAEDFVYAWQRLLKPTLGSEYAYILHVVRHAEAYHSFAGHVAALRGPISVAVGELVEAGGAGAADWQRLLSDTHADQVLQHVSNESLRNTAARREGRLTGEELSTFQAQLGGEADRLERELQHAQTHFGVDQGVFAVDPRTLIVELRAPTPYFLELTAFYPTMPVPRWVIEAPGRSRDWFLPETIVSNGPFRLKSWVVNDHIRLEKSATYWAKEEVGLNSVDVLVAENTTTALNLYLTGAVDWLPDWYPQELAHRLRERPDFYSGPGLAVYYYRINCQRPAFRDARVREALSLAIDRQLITGQVLGLGQLPAYHMVPPGIPGYEQPASGIRLDIVRAQRLLAEAGYPGGKGFPKFGILHNTSETHKKIAEVVADQLRRNLGIEASAYNQEWQSYLQTTRQRDYEVARAAWTGDYRDPNTFLDIWVTNGGNNDTGWSSLDYDLLIRAAGDVSAYLADPEPLVRAAGNDEGLRKLLTEAREATRADGRARALGRARLAILKAAEAVLVQKEFPVIPLYFYVLAGLISPKVEGFYRTIELEDGSTLPNLQNQHPLYSIRMRQ